MAEALMKLDIPQDAVRAIVAAEVAKAVGDPQQFFAAMVAQFLTEQVSDRNYNKQPRIEQLVYEQVSAMALEMVREHLAANREEIRKCIGKALAAKSYAPRLAEALVNAISGSGVYHQVTVNLSLGSKDR